MKRFAWVICIGIVLTVALAVVLPRGMYIEKMKNVDHREYRYRADRALRAVVLQRYHLSDGEWEAAEAAETVPCAGRKGSIVLVEPSDLTGRMEYHLYEGETALSGAISAVNLSEKADVWSADWLNSRVEFAYGEEIPLAVQVLHGKNQAVRAFSTADFFAPETLSPIENADIYALTIRFLRK